MTHNTDIYAIKYYVNYKQLKYKKMTLNRKFQDVEVMFEGQEGSLGDDELCDASNKCERIAEDFAINFAKWLREKTAHTKGGGYKLYNDFQQYNINELLQIFKHSYEADA